MRFVWLEATQIHIVWGVKDGNKVIDNPGILLFEDALEFALDFISLLVILAVVTDFVYKEKRKALYSTIEKFLFFCEMCDNGLAYLHTLHRLFVSIAHHITTINRRAVQECYIATASRVDFRDHEILVLCKPRLYKKRIAGGESFHFAANRAVDPLALQFNANLRRPLWRQHDAIDIHISACAFEVLDLKALYQYTFYKFFAVSVVSIKSIDGIMLGLVSGRIVEHKKRIELCKSRLCGGALHLLRLVHYDNRTVSGNYINRTARAETIRFVVYF